MHKNTIAFVVVAAVGGFIAGFWLANSINRSAIAVPTALPTQSVTTSANSAATPANPDADLTEDEIRAKIAEADKNPTNLSFQKDLGVSLYRYAAMKQDPSLLVDAVRILERANSINNKDFDVLVALGNAHFDIGFYKRDAASFQTARETYAKALAIKPGDPYVMTTLGLTFFLQNPPEYAKAETELRKVSDANPQHERCLQFLVQALIKQNKQADAEKAFAKLKSLNANNPAIPDLTSMIAGGSAK